MPKLTALIPLRVGFRSYQPGETLPAVAPEQEEAWVASGAVIRHPDDYTPPEYTLAKRAAAEPGLPGLAIGGEVTGEDLVGRIPKTEQRRREPWKA